MSKTFELDVYLDSDSDSDLVASLIPYGGTTRCTNPHGPGGGNPVYEFTFPDRPSAVRWYQEVFSPDDHEDTDYYIDGDV